MPQICTNSINLQQVKYHKQNSNYVIFNTRMVTEDGK